MANGLTQDNQTQQPYSDGDPFLSYVRTQKGEQEMDKDFADDPSQFTGYVSEYINTFATANGIDDKVRQKLVEVSQAQLKLAGVDSFNKYYAMRENNGYAVQESTKYMGAHKPSVLGALGRGIDRSVQALGAFSEQTSKLFGGEGDWGQAMQDYAKKEMAESDYMPWYRSTITDTWKQEGVFGVIGHVGQILLEESVPQATIMLSSKAAQGAGTFASGGNPYVGAATGIATMAALQTALSSGQLFVGLEEAGIDVNTNDGRLAVIGAGALMGGLETVGFKGSSGAFKGAGKGLNKLAIKVAGKEAVENIASNAALQATRQLLNRTIGQGLSEAGQNTTMSGLKGSLIQMGRAALAEGGTEVAQELGTYGMERLAAWRYDSPDYVNPTMGELADRFLTAGLVGTSMGVGVHYTYKGAGKAKDAYMKQQAPNVTNNTDIPLSSLTQDPNLISEAAIKEGASILASMANNTNSTPQTSYQRLKQTLNATGVVIDNSNDIPPMQVFETVAPGQIYESYLNQLAPDTTLTDNDYYFIASPDGGGSYVDPASKVSGDFVRVSDIEVDPETGKPQADILGSYRLGTTVAEDAPHAVGITTVTDLDKPINSDVIYGMAETAALLYQDVPETYITLVNQSLVAESELRGNVNPALPLTNKAVKTDARRNNEATNPIIPDRKEFESALNMQPTQKKLFRALSKDRQLGIRSFMDGNIGFNEQAFNLSNYTESELSTLRSLNNVETDAELAQLDIIYNPKSSVLYTINEKATPKKLNSALNSKVLSTQMPTLLSAIMNVKSQRGADQVRVSHIATGGSAMGVPPAVMNGILSEMGTKYDVNPMSVLGDPKSLMFEEFALKALKEVQTNSKMHEPLLRKATEIVGQQTYLTDGVTRAELHKAIDERLSYIEGVNEASMKIEKESLDTTANGITQEKRNAIAHEIIRVQDNLVEGLVDGGANPQKIKTKVEQTIKAKKQNQGGNIPPTDPDGKPYASSKANASNSFEGLKDVREGFKAITTKANEVIYKSVQELQQEREVAYERATDQSLTAAERRNAVEQIAVIDSAQRKLSVEYNINKRALTILEDTAVQAPEIGAKLDEPKLGKLDTNSKNSAITRIKDEVNTLLAEAREEFSKAYDNNPQIITDNDIDYVFVGKELVASPATQTGLMQDMTRDQAQAFHDIKTIDIVMDKLTERIQQEAANPSIISNHIINYLNDRKQQLSVAREQAVITTIQQAAKVETLRSQMATETVVPEVANVAEKYDNKVYSWMVKWFKPGGLMESLKGKTGDSLANERRKMLGFINDSLYHTTELQGLMSGALEDEFGTNRWSEIPSDVKNTMVEVLQGVSPLENLKAYPKIQQSIAMNKLHITNTTNKLMGAISDFMFTRATDIAPIRYKDQLTAAQSVSQSASSQAWLDVYEGKQWTELSQAQQAKFIASLYQTDPILQTKNNLLQSIFENRGTYLNESYKAYMQPSYAAEMQPGKALYKRFIEEYTAELAASSTTGNADPASYTDLAIAKAAGLLNSLENGRDSDIKFSRNEDMSPAVKRYLGVLTNPDELYFQTVHKMHNELQRYATIDRLLDVGKFSGMVTTDPRSDWVNINHNNKELAGYYMHPAIADMYQEFNTRTTTEGAAGLVNMAIATFKMGNTIFSPMSYPTNVIGSVLMYLGSGEVSPFISKNVDPLLKERMIRRAKSEGRMGQNELVDVEDLITYNKDTLDIPGGLSRNKELLSMVRRGWGKSSEMASRFYSAQDDVLKVRFLVNRFERIQKANPEWTFDQVYDRTTRSLSANLQDYTILPRIVKDTALIKTGKTLAGNEVSLKRSWAAPIVNSFAPFLADQLRQIVAHVYDSFDYIRSDNPAMRNIGIRQLTGKTVVAGTMFGVGTAVASLSGIFGAEALQSDQEKEITDALKPSWAAGTQGLIIGDQYLDLGSVYPLSPLMQPAMIGLREYNNTQGTNSDKVIRGTKALLDNLVTDKTFNGILADTFSKIKSKVDRKTGGLTEANYSDYMRELMSLSTADEFMKSASGIYRFLNNAYEASVGAADGYVNETVPPTLAKNVLPKLIGIRMYPATPNASIRSEAYVLSSEIRDIQLKLRNTLNTLETLPPGTVQEVVDSVKVDWDTAFAKMIHKTQTLVRAGYLTPDDVRNIINRDPSDAAKPFVLSSKGGSNIIKKDYVDAILNGVIPKIDINVEGIASKDTDAAIRNMLFDGQVDQARMEQVRELMRTRDTNISQGQRALENIFETVPKK